MLKKFKQIIRRVFPFAPGKTAASTADVPQALNYYDAAEPDIDWQWRDLIWPIIADADFSYVIDLAARHGRNSTKLLQHTHHLTIVEIDQECLDFCRKRFTGDARVEYVLTNGLSLSYIPDNSKTLIYTFDSMVHFDNDVVQAYLKECYRTLKPGKLGFFHHSNFTGNPGGDFKTNVHWRNFMSKELFAHYSIKAGLEVVKQQIIDWGGVKGLDCLSLVRKPI